MAVMIASDTELDPLARLSLIYLHATSKPLSWSWDLWMSDPQSCANHNAWRTNRPPVSRVSLCRTFR